MKTRKTRRNFTFIIGICILCLVGYTSTGFAFFCPDSTLDEKYPEINVGAMVSTAVGNLYEPEAIVPSESGDQFVFIASKGKGLIAVPPTTAWVVRQDKSSNRWTRAVPLFNEGLYSSIGFANNDQWLVASSDYFTLAAIQNIYYLFTNTEALGDLHGFDHRIEIFDTRTHEAIMRFSPANFGLERNEMLKHSRISPDGKWLSFYTHSFAEQRGIYLYNFAEGTTYHLALEDDKHPTWTPDGTKILFHNQRGGNAHTGNDLDLEEARLGYYDLKFKGNEVSWKRVLMDSMGASGIYHKHPSMYAGTDLVFFHKKIRKIENGVPVLSHSMLFVRRAGENTPVYKITHMMTEDSVRIKAIKHIASSANSNTRSGLYFVGREDDDKTTGKSKEYKIYHLSNTDVQKIAKEIAVREKAN